MRFRQAGEQPVAHHPTKYDDLVLRKVNEKYKWQSNSGRATVMQLAEDGMEVGELLKIAASKGFPGNFVLGCIEKHVRSPNAMYSVENKPGTPTYADRKAMKTARPLDPEAAAKRAAKAAEKEAAKAKRLEERTAKKRAKDEAKAAKRAERERAQAEAAEKRREKKAAEAAKVAAQAASEAVDEPIVRKPKKGKKAAA